MKDVQVVAVCDVERETGGYISTVWDRGEVKKHCGREPARKMVNEHYAKDRGVSSYKGCRAYVDYRELLDNEDVDAVLVATPDHTHAVISMAALKKGCHLFCEKPLSYTIHEARELVNAAREAGVATQLGNHGQADERDRITREYIMDGAIGHVREVHVKVGPRWWDAPKGPPVGRPPVPKGLDWDLWLGPAPEVPYHPDYHPWNWRDYRGFGTSELGDIGCHRLSTIFKALKLEHPISAEGEWEEIHPDIYPRKFKVTFEFPQRGELPPVTLIWFDEGYEAPRPKDLEEKRTFKQGNVFYGDEGTMLNHMLIPHAKAKARGLPPKILPRSPGHHREWIDACRGGPPAGADIVKHAGLLTETPLLGNIALTTDKKLHWDGPNLTITNDKAANAQVHREYRKGWSL
ncbi:MAG: Gfo/Idh/MocA family protein [Puniceicoccaceae bacterium]